MRSKLIAALVIVVVAAGLVLGYGAIKSALVDLFDFSFAEKKSPYDWSKLTFNNSRPSYDDKKFTSSIGIDVSEAQGIIDWDAVAADGIEFVFVRLGNRGNTEGGLYPDDLYAYNIKNATAAGLRVNAYFYSQAVTPQEAIDEATYVLGLIEGLPFKGAIAFDHETGSGGRIGDLSGSETTAITRAFCDRIKAAGYDVVVYGNQYDLGRVEEKYLDSSTIWLAEYGVTHPTSPLGMTYWQYTHQGSVNGIATSVDMNMWIKPIGNYR